MKKLFILFLLLLATAAWSKQIPSGVILTDHTGKTYDLDALLGEGRSIVIHKTSAG